MIKKTAIYLIMAILALTCTSKVNDQVDLSLLKVSKNKHFIVDEKNNPFFWLGDTGWLLFKKLDREEAEIYLEDRTQKGFNVIQTMVIHNAKDAVNAYGDSAFVKGNFSAIKTTKGSDFDDTLQYDFWDHIDHIVDLAAEKELYMALVPFWGSNVKDGHIEEETAVLFVRWLAERYKDKTNIIWLNGGDIKGSDSPLLWKLTGSELKSTDPDHLVTFHPRGRTQSSTWFHEEEWLDFNMFQSGHRRYDQDNTELAYGEDNWRYVKDDYHLSPTKPTIDGEPSYEGIPQGLHDTLQPYWNDDDVRRYAYWSVFAGAFGYTYGHNAVMQFYQPGDQEFSFGPREYWYDAINNPGASQMIHLKNLILSRPFLERIPDQSLIAGFKGERYDYMVATRGNDYAFIYNYTGRNMCIVLGKIDGRRIKASWYDPRQGRWQEIGELENTGAHEFNPPGEQKNGNDWVLVLDRIE
ncbi:hypothetical protein ES703_73244 [subsurface metagenome]